MVNLLFVEDDDVLSKPGVVRTIYDPTARYGGHAVGLGRASDGAETAGSAHHVRAGAERRLLEERPTAIGLSVPGMPAGSPGMEGGTPKRYDVILFGKTGLIHKIDVKALAGR